MNKIILNKVSSKEYKSSSGITLKREYSGSTPNGNKLDGQWVLRDCTEEFITFGTYREDIAEHYNLTLIDNVK